MGLWLLPQLGYGYNKEHPKTLNPKPKALLTQNSMGSLIDAPYTWDSDLEVDDCRLRGFRDHRNMPL